MFLFSPPLVILSALFFGGLFASNTKAEPTQIVTEQQFAAQIRKAAEQGDVVAQTNLGRLYEKGIGVPQDYSQAVVWFRKAAEQGDADTQTNLAWMYEKGLGVPQDYSQTFAWYRKAAERGHAGAQSKLGGMYELNIGVPQDYNQAAAWYRKAAEQGYAGAQYDLGRMYINGQGVPQDYSQAYMWVNLATAQGFDSEFPMPYSATMMRKAVTMRDTLVKKLTPSQTEEGQRLAREWIAKHPQGQVAQ